MGSTTIGLGRHADLEQPDCLTRNNYDEARCQDAVKALYECCDAFYQRFGDEATSPSCPKPNLLRLKIKQQKEGK
ncbi:Cx9C motif-containing protein 4, mitochondrial [Tolypocladium capitatum]|uniref:Cx9C motif-containing protein 4, mitochondrial n=1 Tax=Tolypocladium capitatum TaxID=45235 RepID=A0A2K3QKY6_9HYPO|nr:Cx9C motif-containing protein 4, mitochondrial [Tolypocladium capitatum]